MTEDDFIDTVEDAVLRHDPHVTTGAALSRQIDEVSKPKVLEALRVLERLGAVASVETGANAVAWWHTDRVVPAPPPTPADHPDQAGLEDASRPAPAPRPTEEPRDDEEPTHAPLTGVDDVEEYLTDRPPKTAHGKRAVVEAARYLRENGPASTSDVQDAVFAVDEVAAHYSTKRTMWNAIDRYLEDVPGIEKPGYGEWDFNSN